MYCYIHKSECEEKKMAFVNSSICHNCAVKHSILYTGRFPSEADLKDLNIPTGYEALVLKHLCQYKMSMITNTKV